ncbi:hypothetical protein THIOSC13_160044 [uncultured Thiomicrorhabdus sp.]
MRNPDKVTAKMTDVAYNTASEYKLTLIFGRIMQTNRKAQL